MGKKELQVSAPDPLRPYPDGIPWDEAWRQRQRADAAEAERDEARNSAKLFLDMLFRYYPQVELSYYISKRPWLTDTDK